MSAIEGRPVIEALEVSKLYRSAGGQLTTAVDAVSLSVGRGRTLGVVGESGSGKTTLAKMILRLEPVTSGQLLVDGIDVARPRAAENARLHRILQVVFQDPYSSMNPRMRISRVLAEGIRLVHPRDAVADEVDRLLDLVGLPVTYRDRYPHQLSGGQRQRVAIARALSVNPQILVADEPVSALDVSMRGQILNLLSELRTRLGLTCIFISHDLGVVQQFCDSVIVMHRGRIVESGEPNSILQSPSDPYTQRLVAAIPRIPS